MNPADIEIEVAESFHFLPTNTPENVVNHFIDSEGGPIMEFTYFTGMYFVISRQTDQSRISLTCCTDCECEYKFPSRIYLLILMAVEMK
jgi:hypothetical protein